jgi:hypothetical protein
LRSGDSERPELVETAEFVGVLADISFDIRVISWSSPEIIGEAGVVIDIVLNVGEK